MKNKSILLLIAVLALAAGAFAFGQDFISNISLSNTTGVVGDHFSAHVVYQIGWFTPRRGGGPINVTRSDVPNPQYEIFAHPLPPGLSFDNSTGYLTGTPTESGQWEVRPAVRNSSGRMYSGHGYWFTSWTTDSNTGLVYATPKDAIVIKITR